MDRYKFRGKPEDVEFIESECFFPEEFYKDGFVYGQLVSDNIIAYGVVNAEDDFITFEYWARVEPSTVGQYTGIVCCEGNKLYEGDIVENEKFIGEIEWVMEHSAFSIYCKQDNRYHSINSDGKLKHTRKIGNIHDNPELLKGE